jgi:hypothetical protein
VTAPARRVYELKLWRRLRFEFSGFEEKMKLRLSHDLKKRIQTPSAALRIIPCGSPGSVSFEPVRLRVPLAPALRTIPIIRVVDRRQATATVLGNRRGVSMPKGRTIDLANLFGISERRVQQLVKEGLPRDGRGKFDFVKSVNPP